MKAINYNTYRNTQGFNHRVRFLVMHYTASNFSDSITSLTGANVSAHYLIPDVTDPSYLQAGFKEQEVFNLVDEQERAWHAGVSHWGNRSGLNDTAIGIEIVNLASDTGGQFQFPPYEPQQIEAAKQLALNILARHPDITPVNVIGHSDIAVGRKSDPGPRFPWHELYLAGVGAWYDETSKMTYHNEYNQQALPSKATLIGLFKRYGYNTSAANTNNGYRQLVQAFQLHFRQSNYNGVMDNETAAILKALVSKYFP